MAGFPFVVFLVHPPVTQLNGEVATSRSYVEETLEDNDGNAMRMYGVYDDELIREGGSWKFKTRRYNVLYRGSIELSGQKTGYRG